MGVNEEEIKMIEIVTKCNNCVSWFKRILRLKCSWFKNVSETNDDDEMARMARERLEYLAMSVK